MKSRPVLRLVLAAWLVLSVVPLVSASSRGGWRRFERSGDRHFRAQEYEKALDCYRKAIMEGPRKTPARLWRKQIEAFSKTPAGMEAGDRTRGEAGRELPAWMQRRNDLERLPLKDTYAPGEMVKARFDHSLATCGSPAEPAVVRAPEYEISGLSFSFPRSGRLVVRGKVRNTSSFTIHNPRIYVALYDDAGRLVGRNWGYCRFGRNSLEEGREKDFQVVFLGFQGTVAWFKASLSARFHRDRRWRPARTG